MTTQTPFREAPPAEEDSRPAVLHCVPWTQYEGLVALLGDNHPSLRLTYLRGTLEIMTTSCQGSRTQIAAKCSCC